MAHLEQKIHCLFHSLAKPHKSDQLRSIEINWNKNVDPAIKQHCEFWIILQGLTLPSNHSVCFVIPKIPGLPPRSPYSKLPGYRYSPHRHGPVVPLLQASVFAEVIINAPKYAYDHNMNMSLCPFSLTNVVSVSKCLYNTPVTFERRTEKEVLLIGSYRYANIQTYRRWCTMIPFQCREFFMAPAEHSSNLMR